MIPNPPPPSGVVGLERLTLRSLATQAVQDQFTPQQGAVLDLPHSNAQLAKLGMQLIHNPPPLGGVVGLARLTLWSKIQAVPDQLHFPQSQGTVLDLFHLTVQLAKLKN